MPETIAAWHRVVEAKDPALPRRGAGRRLRLPVSPAVHTPQEGKAVTTQYLAAALVVLGPTLTYRREWYADGLGGPPLRGRARRADRATAST